MTENSVGFLSKSQRLSTKVYINLGFSGSAKAEDEIAEYIKSLDMSVFVYDYDHNSPTLQHLEATHQRMFQTIRRHNPELPIIILSRPKYRLGNADKKRLTVIKKHTPMPFLPEIKTPILWTAPH